jgi:adenosylhomocysteine nucleosidase
VHPILVLTAVEFEARALARELDLPLLPSSPFLAFGRGSVRLAPVGLRACLCESRWVGLLEGLDGPLVISAGVCGGLDPRLAAGDLVIPLRVMGPTGELPPVAAAFHQRAVACAPATVCTGPLVTTGDVVATPEAKASLRGRSGAVAADMESAFIVARATASGCPALVVRAVSDSAGESLPLELVRLVTPRGSLRLTRALALAVTCPSVLPRALTLRRRTGQALRAVAGVLAALLRSRQ